VFIENNVSKVVEKHKKLLCNVNLYTLKVATGLIFRKGFLMFLVQLKLEIY